LDLEEEPARLVAPDNPGFVQRRLRGIEPVMLAEDSSHVVPQFFDGGQSQAFHSGRLRQPGRGGRASQDRSRPVIPLSAEHPVRVHKWCKVRGGQEIIASRFQTTVGQKKYTRRIPDTSVRYHPDAGDPSPRRWAPSAWTDLSVLAKSQMTVMKAVLSGTPDLEPEELLPVKPRRPWATKFREAFRGIKLGVRGHSSFSVHFFFAALVVATAIALRSSLLEWCILLGCIGMVLTAELFNSAVEALFHGLEHTVKEHARNSLHIAAGAVLLASISAAIIGSIIFLNRLLALWE
jgi:diacylglycerol kinase